MNRFLSQRPGIARARALALACGLALLSSCARTPVADAPAPVAEAPAPVVAAPAPVATPAPAPAPVADTACTGPRTKMCTRDYNPVCATRDTGIRCITAPCPSSERKTFSSACSACLDPHVSGWTPGACPGG